MDERKQFTFFISYWQAIEELPEKDQLPILKAIIKYALFGEEPSALRGVRRAVFLLVKPTLDSSRKKSASGKQGGSKPKANRKQTPTENEGEMEIEGEVEMEKEYECNENDDAADESAPVRYAGEKALASIGLKAGEYPCVTAETVAEVKRMTQELIARYAPMRCCTTADCRKVFLHAYRSAGSRTALDTAAAGLLEYAFEAASLAGHGGNWFYIDGILTRCSDRGIYTADMARDWDADRPDLEQGVGT